MAEEAIIVSSAVVVPDASTSATGSPTNTSKRRASSASSTSAKRPKVDIGNEGADAPRKSLTRRGEADADERKRGKRLFGGLFGTLSQNSASTAQKRRTDIDRKQREKLRAQADEDQELRKQRLEKLAVSRRAEQVIWDRQALNTKHENERTLARFLRTNSKPNLYYKPWEMRPEEEELIKQQILEVEKRIDLEIAGGSPEPPIAATKDVEMETEPGGHAHNLEASPMNYDSSEKQDNALSVHNGNGNAGNGENADGPSHSKEQASTETLKDHMDETGEDVVQGDEDAVLY